MSSNEKFNFYREILVWPLADDLNFEDWLENFSEGKEREIAKCILDFFIYIPDKMINQMLSTVVGKCGYYFKKERGNWTNRDFNENCYYSFIKGEEGSPTDSGYLFTRKLRDELGIEQSRLVEFNKLHTLLSENYDLNVILVDDLVGSGTQAYNAWCNWKKTGSDLTLQQIVLQNNHKVVYAPLIVNHMGYNFIHSHCKGLHLEYVHLLDDTYSLFNPNCPCWKGDINLFQEGTTLISNQSLSLGIPFVDDRHVNYVKGYMSQGLALAFEHGIPDASLPIFYWAEDWNPLMKKQYQRPL